MSGLVCRGKNFIRSLDLATETRANDLVSIPDSVIDPNRLCLIDNFSEHYGNMSTDSDFRFSEKFEEQTYWM